MADRSKIDKSPGTSSNVISALRRKFGRVESSMSPLMVRDLEGKIFYWNSSAQRRYGWKQNDAVGNVSHLLLNTVFPEPLELINYQLIHSGVWKGELIHTRSDGTRVKVSSKWELRQDEEGKLRSVIEINDDFSELGPDSAHLAPKPNWWRRLRVLLLSSKAYWLVPMLLVIFLFALFIALTPHSPRYLEHHSHKASMIH